MTETTQDGADVLERLSFSVRTADGVTILDFHAGGCRPATSSEIECLRELTRLRAENEALKEALRDLLIFYGDDTEAREVLRSDFTGPEPLLMDDDALRESVWNNARAALSKATGGSHEQG